MKYMYKKIIIFVGIIAITLLELIYYVLSGTEIYPGITYPAFSRQFHLINSERPIFCEEESNSIVTSVTDYCLNGEINPKYAKAEMVLEIVFDSKHLPVKSKNLFPYIDFPTEEKAFRRKMLTIGYWWKEDRHDDKIYSQEKYLFKVNILNASKRLLANSEVDKNLRPKALLIKLIDHKNIIFSSSIPLN